MPPIRGASGWRMSAARASISRTCSADAGQHLAGGDRGVERRGQLRVPLGVVRVERFLDPDQVELLQRPPDPQRRTAIPLLVGVDHQRYVGAEMLADGVRPDPGRSGCRAGRP